MLLAELNLNKFLHRSLEEMGYIYATPIQEQALPIVLSGKDMVGIAQTGTGKTLAYLLPILKNLKFSEQRNPRVLIVVPTRELVMQVVKEIERLTTYMSVRVIGVYGGANINTQRQAVHKGLDILVATPGRLMDLLLDGSIRSKSIQKLVIDEVDELLNLGFRVQLKNILDMMPEKRQNLMFSATMSEDVQSIIESDFFNPEILEIARTGTPLENIEQRVYHVPNFHSKVNLLQHLLGSDPEMTKVLIFMEGRKKTDFLHQLLGGEGNEKMGVIHSNKSQNQRFKAVENFQSGEIEVLIATDVISRGVDIDGVSHVISFDVPEVPSAYMHRIGRTGRADKDGIAILLVSDAEEEAHVALEVYMHKEIELFEIPEEVEFSEVYLEDEKPTFRQKQYLKAPTLKRSGGNTHEKKDKNKKVNLGGSYRRKIKAKYKKPKTRGSKRK